MHWITCTQSVRSYIPVCEGGWTKLFDASRVTNTRGQIDISAGNIMFELDDEDVLTEFEEAEVKDPSPRKKDADGRIIYVSRELSMPKHVGAPILCDFGSAVLGHERHVEDVQPDVYRAPEVIFEVPWSYSIDVWNLGCMVSFSVDSRLLGP